YLFFFYGLMKNSISPSIPLPTSEKIYSHTPYPMISTILSISSLLFSIYILQSRIVTVVHLYCGILLSLVSTIMAIGTDRMEQLWWGIPLGFLIVDIIALYIIRDSEPDINGLEN
ncbi:28695_t:CDS:1, partial [Dentiscutata erythropus]